MHIYLIARNEHSDLALKTMDNARLRRLKLVPAEIGRSPEG